MKDRILKLGSVTAMIAVFVAGLAVTLMTSYVLMNQNRAHAEAALTRAVQRTSDAVAARIHLYEFGLRGARGALQVMGEQQASRHGFLTYIKTRDLDTEFPGARGFGFIRRVPASAEAAFLQKARLDGKPDFTIRQLTPHEGERFVIQYIEPQEKNLAAVGLDIASEKNRREAAGAAMRTGAARLTGPITLVQATGKPLQSFLFLLPIYRTGNTPDTVAERVAQGFGWSYAPLLTEEVLTGLPLPSDGIRLHLRDVTDAAAPVQFYERNQNGGEQQEVMRTHLTQLVFGRRWEIELVAYPSFVQELRQFSPRSAFGIGLCSTLLITALVGVFSVSRRRRRDVLAEQAKLAAIVENSNDGIIGQTLDGIVTAWNHGAEKIFGYGSDEVLGRTLLGRILPCELADEEVHLLEKIARSERIEHFETRRVRKDGQSLDVSVTVSPICDAAGRVVGASKTVRDITQQKRAEARILELNVGLEHQVAERTTELRELNALLTNVLHSASQVSIIATDLEGIITVFNKGAEQLLGYTAEEVVGLRTPGMFHLDEEMAQRGEELSRAYGEAIGGFRVFVHKASLGEAEVREWTYVRKDGTRFSVTLLVTGMHNADGRLSGYLGIAIDISRRKQVEERLADSLALTQTILDTAVNPVIRIDRTGLIQSCNRATQNVFGYQPDELVGSNVRVLLPALFEGDLSLSQDAFGDPASSNMTGVSREVEARRKDGLIFPAQVTLGCMQIGGQPMLVAVLFDLSEQRRQHDAIASARDQLALASDVAKLGVWTWSPEDDDLQWNDRMFEIYEQPLALKAVGLSYKHWQERLHPDDAEVATRLLQGLLDGYGVFETLFRLQLPGGDIRYVQAAARIEYVAETGCRKVIGINRDVTVEHELQSRLFLAKEQADAANAAKSAFLANMSHEIRTPMNAVLGMLHLVQATELDARQLDYIRKAHGAAKSLLGLLNDILDYSKIEAGKLQLDPHPFEINGLMTDLAAVLGGNQAEKDVELLFDLDTSLPQCLVGDSLRLQQILINLAGNALKFTERGEITVSLRVCDRRPDAVRLRISVTDTGIGISEEQLQRIFDGFSQAEASISRRYGGTGLGLAICKRLIELMGGILRVDSQPGVGSCFWFELEFALANTMETEHTTVFPHLNVLVVDDNHTAREVLARTAVALGWQVDQASRGREAVERVLRAANVRPYDVVLMDWRMPDVDGLTAARLIRDSLMDSAPVVVMVTAHSHEVFASLQQGPQEPYVAVLSKPITPKQLATTVELAVSGTQSSNVTGPVSPLSRLDGIKLLVVEDNPLNRQVAQELLELEGAKVTLAEGGQQGVEAVLNGVQTFDAVLMDIQMPDMDGLEATRRIRQSPLHWGLPIVAMTANASTSEREACLAAGMNEHVGKPVDLENLVAVLRKLLDREVPVRPAIQSSDSPSDESTESVLRRFGGNLTLLRNVLQRFPDEMRRNLDKLERHCSNSEKAGVLMQLHTIKGSAGTMGASGLSALAAELEQRLLQASPEEGQSFMANPRWLSHLHMQLASDCTRLNLAFATSVVFATERPLAFTERDWEIELSGLRALLVSSNLVALQRAESLQDAVPLHSKAIFDALKQAVDDLDFQSAALWCDKLTDSLKRNVDER
ncbi:PAS domain S-box protein [Pseudomonas sp. CJQ_8]|uniref:PAS domain S-box protein n=1 Tax=Pseudomonas sp. CJQ_8 TaxID=3367167 RepID=UPI00370BF82D